MSAPGWYPDPAGQPNTFRYWDGQAWSEQTTQTASPPPPPGAPGGTSDATQVPGAPAADSPPQYGTYGQSAYGQGSQGWSMPPSPQPTQSPPGRGKRVALIVLAAVLVVGLVVGGTFAVLAFTDDSGDDDAADDGTSESATPQESDEPDETPTDEPSASTAPAEPTGRECTGGAPSAGGTTPQGPQIQGGGLSTPEIAGFQPLAVEPAFTFADGVATLGRQIEELWISVYAVGSLTKDNGFTNLEQAAETVLTCMVESSDFYTGFSGRTDLASSSIEVDGNDGWSLSAEVRVDDPNITVEGDVARVIVVETGDPDSFSLFVSVVPIGDQELIGQQQDVVDQLEVE